MRNWQALVMFVILVTLGVRWMKNHMMSSKPDSQFLEQPLIYPAELAPGDRVEPLDRRAAKNYYVVFDGSGSMNDLACESSQSPHSKLEAARRAVAKFASSLPRDANLGLAVFDRNGLSERLPLGQNQYEAFKQEVDRVIADGGTPLRSAITLAGSRLARQASRQMGYGEYHLVVVTDGDADPSEQEDPAFIVDSILQASPIVFHTVGFCIGNQHSLHQEGKVLYQSANNSKELRKGLKDVLAEATTFSVDAFKKPH